MSGLKTLIIDENSSAIVNGRLQENLSLEWCDGQAQPLIEAGQSVPIFRNKIFSTADDYQESITLRLFIGNAPSIPPRKLSTLCWVTSRSRWSAPITPSTSASTADTISAKSSTF